MTRWASLLTLAALLFFPSATRADEPAPDLATIRAKIAAAEGTDPSASHKSYLATYSNGVTLVERVARRDKDYRDVVDYGPFHTESGSSKGQDWYQNDNGQTVLDQPDPHPPIPEVTTTRVSRVHAPVDAYLIATLDARGDGTKEYVDPTTWQIVRRERIRPGGTTTIVYDDFRLDHGRTFAHHWHTENGVTRTAQDTRITNYDTGPVTDGEVATAPPRRELVTFPADIHSVVLPTQFGSAHIYVRVTINGRGLDFVLDSGAGEITMDSTVAKQLGLPAYDAHSTITAGRYTTARTIVPEMRVGDLVMRNVAVQLAPQGWQAEPEVKEVGLLGFDFLAELGVTIDYEHRRVTAVPGAEYVAPTDPQTIPLDVRIGSGSPLATASINGASGDRWTLDTGATGTFMIFDYFARRHPQALRDRGGDGSRSTPMNFYGIGGAFETRPYEIADLQLGSMHFTNFVGYRVTSSQSYSGNEDGLIGETFLRLFTVGLDYGDSRVYLVPNDEARRAMTTR